MNRKQRMANRATAEKLKRSNPPTRRCSNCGKLMRSGHFVPPSFGMKGFYACDSFKDGE